MTNRGKIKSVDGEFAVVSVVREGSCGDNCAMCSACKYKTVDVKAYNTLNLNVGDYVEFESNSLFVYLGLLILFIIPVLFPICTYLLFDASGVYIATAFAAASFLLSVLGVFALSKSQIYLKKVTPKIVKVLNY